MDRKTGSAASSVSLLLLFFFLRRFLPRPAAILTGACGFCRRLSVVLTGTFVFTGDFLRFELANLILNYSLCTLFIHTWVQTIFSPFRLLFILLLLHAFCASSLFRLYFLVVIGTPGAGSRIHFTQTTSRPGAPETQSTLNRA